MQNAAQNETHAIPIPAMVAAIWGGFLYEGLLVDQDGRLMDRILDTWGQGCIELVIAACLHLPEVWEQISLKWESEDCDFPGVFEYEVISPLGTYFGSYLLAHDGEMPTAEQVRVEIQRLIANFLRPLEQRLPVPLDKAS